MLMMLKKKKTLIKRIVFLCISVMFIFLTACNQKNEGIEKIKVAEVAHSVFYAPQYIAINNGYFAEEGLEIELVNANGADKVTASLLSKDVQIGLQGPEPTIYLYLNDSKNYLVNFAGLTTTDGAFIFGREPIENFSLDMLKGKSILGGRAGGIPEMTLEYVLKKAGLNISRNDSNADVNVRTDIAFAAMAASFLNGEGDFTTLFEPTASEMVLNGNLYLLASVGEYAGEITYTAYSCLKEYYDKNPEILEKFVRAIYRGQQFVMNSTDEEVAASLAASFPDVDLSTLISVVARYKSINAFATTPIITRTGMDNLQNIMIEAGELSSKVSFDILVKNDISLKIVENK
jgi:NitT/TauT family transport system substrate-binding protein